MLDTPEPTPPVDTEDESEATSFLASLGLQSKSAPDTELPDPRSQGYKRLSRAEEARIVRLAAEDVPVLKIAELMGRSHATVYAVLEDFTPTIEDARKYLDGLALPAAKTLKDTMRPGANDRVRMESATKVLETVGLAPTGDSKGHSVQVAVVIGGPAQCPIPVSD